MQIFYKIKILCPNQTLRSNKHTVDHCPCYIIPLIFSDGRFEIATELSSSHVTTRLIIDPLEMTDNFDR